MKFSYFPDTDTLYIDFADKAGVDSEEVGPDVVIDVDENDTIVGMEIERASEKVDLENLSFASLPFQRTGR